MNNEIKTTLILIAAGLVVIGSGIWAVIEPDLLIDYDPRGRYIFVKEAIKSIWGTAGGIVAIVFGLFMLCLAAFMKKSDEDAS